jgi:hypothetical protein
MFIPDVYFSHPGSRIRIKEFKYFNPKKLFLSSWKNDLGCSSRISNAGQGDVLLKKNYWVLRATLKDITIKKGTANSFYRTAQATVPVQAAGRHSYIRS